MNGNPPIIRRLRALEVLDSRGNPTVEAMALLDNGVCARFAVPSGASTGSREAVEKRDGDGRFGGKGVRQAVSHVNGRIAEAVVGQPVDAQEHVDSLLIDLDGSGNKSSLGANAILAVSMAVKKAAAQAAGRPLYRTFGDERAAVLPIPLMNILNGGAHASNALDIQEFMVVPHGFETFAEALRAGVETFHALRDLLAENHLSTAVGDEGGFAPEVGGSAAAMDWILRAIECAGYSPGEQIGLALDCAASEFHSDGRYDLPADHFSGDAAAFVAQLDDWVRRYPIVSVEDGCDEDDWRGWRLLTERLGERIQLVGDDLFVTNPAVLERGIGEKVANALLVKPNQIGTVSETVAAVRMAQAAGYGTVMSHRSGESEYGDIADWAVGMGCRQIKAGAPCRGERTAKYNRLLRIADELGEAAEYAGRSFRVGGRRAG